MGEVAMNRSTGAIHLVSLAALLAMLLSLALPSTSGANGLAVGWQTETPLSSPLSGGLGLVAASEQLITLGGQNLSSGEPVASVLRNQINPWGDLDTPWDLSGNPPLIGPRALHASFNYSSASGDRACVIGGWDGSSPLTSVQCAQLNEAGYVVGAWQTGFPLPDGPRMNLGAAVSGKLVYVAGGWDWYQSQPRSEVYVSTIQENGSLENWRHVVSLPLPLFGLSLSAYGDYLYVAGGHDGSAARAEVYRAHITDAQGNLNGWTKLAGNDGKDLLSARERHAAVVYQGHLLVLGGRDAGGASKDTVFAAAINANGSLGDWATDFLPAMPQPLDRHAAVVVDVPHCGEVIYVAGGRSGANYERSVYRTDCPLTDPWSDWKAAGAPTGLRVCLADRVSIVYGNQTGEGTLVATLDDGGPVTFDKLNDNYTWNYDLTEVNGVYDLRLKHKSDTTPSAEAFSLNGTIDGVQVGSGSLSGVTAECAFLPLVLRNAP
jgi:hypothetical protein